MDDFDYLPEGSWPAGGDPYRAYADDGSGRPAGRRAAGQRGYPVGPMNTSTGPQPAGGWRTPRYQSPGGRPPSGPMPAYRADGAPAPAYRAPDERPARGYPPRPGTGPMPAYQPGSGPMPAYQREGRPGRAYQAGGGPTAASRTAGGRPGPGYQPADSGPLRQMQRDSGPLRQMQRDSGPLRRMQRDSGPLQTLLLDSGPMPAQRPPAARPAAGHQAPDGRQILGWLPFGNRIVLLPKAVPFEDSGESLRAHRDVNGGWLRPAVFGAMDGLVTNASLIAGIGGGGGGGGMIVLTGLAGLIAGAFSMATGEYISVRSQNELNLAEVELERKQHARDPVGKHRRLTEIYMEKGVSPNLAEAVVRQISADPERAVAAHAREELGIDPDDLPSPRTAAGASFASFIVGALIPLAPFLAGFPALSVALVISGLAAFVGGAAVAKLTGRSMLLGGARQFTAAALATGAAFGLGHAVGGHVG